MISTVAVGTDGSETASKAVETAADMAHRYDAKLVLISAFSDEGHGGRTNLSGSSLEIQWATSPAARLTEQLERQQAALRASGIDCTTMIEEGDPADVLVSLAERCGADLLVIGNKGMQRRVLGSVPNTVTHKAGCSVLVVKTT
jgi:nucleotide-binding universal stress UspA family protein